MPVAPSSNASDADRVRELFFELSPDAILVFRQGVVTQANPAAVDLLRAKSASELVGMRSSELIHASSHPTVEANVQAIEAGARFTRSDEIYLRLDGTEVEVEVSAARATFYAERAFVVIVRDMTVRRELALRRQREEEALRQSELAIARERCLRDVFDDLPSAAFAYDDEGRFVLVNRACAGLAGVGTSELIGRTACDAGLGHLPFFERGHEDRDLLATGAAISLPEIEITNARGERRVVQTTKVRASFEGRPIVLGVVTDLTEQRSLQLQLLHSQKMESLGRLAGGIAHDFNNLLTVVIECTDHLGEAIPDQLTDLATIREAATRAASLTRRLLAFARQAPGHPRALVLDELLAQTTRLLGRVLGEDIVLTTSFGAPGEYVSLEPEQFELVLINFAVNARDAMPRGGTLAITSKTVPSASGRSIEIEIRDSGTGMDEATRSRALEPFFTTKAEGVGTGLGLSTCLGILQQAGGDLELESELGRGTTVRIHLPVRSPPTLAPAEATSGAVSGPLERPATVLMVEDDPHVRRATHRMLRALGYSVLTAAAPREALALAREHPGPIDVLLTDVVMPGMNGAETARNFRELRPSAAVVFVSGHARDAFSDATAEVVHYLGKPFSREELSVMLRQAIEQQSASNRANVSRAP